MADKKVPNLKAKYQAEVAPALMQKFGYKSVMQIPKLDKVVINVACGAVSPLTCAAMPSVNDTAR